MSRTDLPLGELNPPVRFGNYLLIERLGAGPLVEVFRAKTQGIEGFERFVSLRRLRADADPDDDAVRTFVEDAKRASALHHANIAQVVDLGRADDTYYVAAEFVHGPNLEDLCARAARRGRTIPVPLACHVAIKILEGLEYAHNRTDEAGQPLELLHSGIAPADVGVSSEGHIKLLRFSATSFRRVAATGPGVGADRLGYMSPEQVRGLPLDRRSDTFAVGIILHELLTGRRLFTGDSDFAVLERIRKVEVTPPTLLSPDVPSELEEIVLRALSRAAQGRYQTAGHMARELQKFVFQSELYTSDAELRAFVAELFPELGTDPAAPAPPTPTLPDLDWDDEEIQTAVFGRNDDDLHPGSAAPTPDEELGEWSRDLATGVHRPTTRSSTSGSQAPVTADLGDPGLVDELSIERGPGTFGDFAIPSGQIPAVTVPASPDANTGNEPTVDDVLAGTPTTGARTAVQRPEVIVSPAQFDRPVSAKPRSWVWLVAAVVIGGLVGALVFALRDSGQTQAVRVSLTPRNLQYELQLDGNTVHQGAVPHAIQGVRPGQYTLTAIAPGHQARTEAITVEAGSDLVVDWQLLPVRTTAVPFRSTPEGATVLIGGEPRGNTPLELTLPVGERVELELRLPGYDTHSTGFVVSERASAVTIALSPSPPPGDGSADGSGAGGEPGLGAAVPDPIAAADSPDAPEQQPDRPAETEPSRPEPGTRSAGDTTRTAERAERERTERASNRESDDRAEAASRAEREASDRAERQRAEREAAERETAEREAAARAEREAAARAERERAERDARAQREATPPPPPAPITGPPGYLSVQSMTPATVIIDGETVGQTPINNIPLPPGSYRVELVNAAAGVDRSYRVSIESGRARTIVNR